MSGKLSYQEEMNKFDKKYSSLSANERAKLLWRKGLVKMRRGKPELKKKRVNGDRCKYDHECEGINCVRGRGWLSWGICKPPDKKKEAETMLELKMADDDGVVGAYELKQAYENYLKKQKALDRPADAADEAARAQQALAAANRLKINPGKQFHADDSVEKEYEKMILEQKEKDDRVKKNLEEQKERGVNVRNKLMTIINNADIEKRNDGILKVLGLQDPEHTDWETIETKVRSLGLDNLLKQGSTVIPYRDFRGNEKILQTIVDNLQQKPKTTGGKKKRKHHTRKHKKSNRKSNRKSKHHKKSHKGGNKKSNRKTHKRTKHHKKRGHKSRRRR